MSEQASETQTGPGWACPHDGCPLLPVADTPHWFQCAAEGPRHYFYKRAGSEGGGWIDVDTNEPVQKALPSHAARGRGRPAGPPPASRLTGPQQAPPEPPE